MIGVDRLWSREEKEELGIGDENEILTIDEFKERVSTLKDKLNDVFSDLKNV